MKDDDSRDMLRTGAALDVFENLSSVENDVAEKFVGRTLGQYRIDDVIAIGGMSIVFLASRTDGSFDRDVAIKLSPTSVVNAEFRDRFVREQHILAELNHPRISQLYDAGITEEGWPYIVMELIDGESIDQFVETRDHSIGSVVPMMIQVADAIAFAHSRNVIHRDIKPSNVLVREDGNPVLLDFGIAKLAAPDETQLTKVHALTPGYASPEQLLGMEVTAASDVYQLGLLLAQLLTGNSAAAETTLEEAINRAARGIPVALDHSSQIPNELKRIVEYCLRVDPAERYATAAELKDDLVNFVENRPVSAAGQARAYRFKKLIQRNRLVAGTAGAGVIALAIGVYVTTRVAAPDPCIDPVARLDGIWDQAQRQSASSAFVATGLPFAPSAVSRIESAIDGFTGRWRTMHIEACEANRVSGTQSDELFDRRMMCLDDQLTQLRAISDQVVDASRSTVLNVGGVIGSLPDISQCADLNTLSRGLTLPPPEKIEQINELKAVIAQIQVRMSAGLNVEASDLLDSIRDTALEIGYEPLAAEVELLTGRLRAEQSNPEFEVALQSAIDHASDAGDTRLLAEIWLYYAELVAQELGNIEDARRLLLPARAAVRQLSDESALRFELANAEGGIEIRAGDFRKAREKLLEAMEIGERTGHPRTFRCSAKPINGGTRAWQLRSCSESGKAARSTGQGYVW